MNRADSTNSDHNGVVCRIPENGADDMVINFITIQPLVALIAGILILLIPRLLNLIVAIYLILIGVAGVLPHLHLTQ
jgi:hypothetical protein